MRFSTFIILGIMAVMLSACGARFCSWQAREHARRQQLVELENRSYEQAMAQAAAQRYHQQQTMDPWDPRRRFAQEDSQTIHYNSYPPIGVRDNSSENFDWSELTMALVMLAGGTLVCRRIFRSSSSKTRQVNRYARAVANSRYASITQPQRPPMASAPPVATMQVWSRMCRRADCGSMNPAEAKFCRRCGSPLSEA